MDFSRFFLLRKYRVQISARSVQIPGFAVWTAFFNRSILSDVVSCISIFISLLIFFIHEERFNTSSSKQSRFYRQFWLGALCFGLFFNGFPAGTVRATSSPASICNIRLPLMPFITYPPYFSIGASCYLTRCKISIFSRVPLFCY